MTALRIVDVPLPRDVESQMVRPGVQAAAAGSRRGLLVALRDHLAGEIDAGVPARDLASLSLRLLAIAREIEEIDAATEGDDVGNAADTPDDPWPAG